MPRSVDDVEQFQNLVSRRIDSNTIGNHVTPLWERFLKRARHAAFPADPGIARQRSDSFFHASTY
jgi:hypothetical protein